MFNLPKFSESFSGPNGGLDRFSRFYDETRWRMDIARESREHHLTRDGLHRPLRRNWRKAEELRQRAADHRPGQDLRGPR